MRRLASVICPKCQNLMQTVDKRGVHIEQCQGCKGIFLDRGELEQIAGAEQNYYAASPPYRGDSPPPYARHQSGGGHYRDSPPPYGHQSGHGGHHRRRRGFLEELFD
ncbi:MAG: zf-TFIIB domain-containing protein [Pseudonocardiaceae bacterium]